MSNTATDGGLSSVASSAWSAAIVCWASATAAESTSGCDILGGVLVDVDVGVGVWKNRCC